MGARVVDHAAGGLAWLREVSVLTKLMFVFRRRPTTVFIGPLVLGVLAWRASRHAARVEEVSRRRGVIRTPVKRSALIVPARPTVHARLVRGSLYPGLRGAIVVELLALPLVVEPPVLAWRTIELAVCVVVVLWGMPSHLRRRRARLEEAALAPRASLTRPAPAWASARR